LSQQEVINVLVKTSAWLLFVLAHTHLHAVITETSKLLTWCEKKIPVVVNFNVRNEHIAL